MKKYLNCTCYGSKNIKRKPNFESAKQAILSDWPMRQIQGFSGVSRRKIVELAKELGYVILRGDKTTGQERFYQFEEDIIKYS